MCLRIINIIFHFHSESAVVDNEINIDPKLLTWFLLFFMAHYYRFKLKGDLRKNRVLLKSHNLATKIFLSPWIFEVVQGKQKEVD